MELTLEILLYFIKEMNPIILKMKSDDNSYVGIKQFFPEDTDVSDDYLYICGLAELWEHRACVPESMTILAAENLELEPEQIEEIPCNLVLVGSQYKLPYILNQMIGIFSRVANWDKMMHIAALEGKSVQELLDISEEILEHPAIIFDAGFEVLAYTKSVPAGNKYFKETAEHGYSDTKVMEQMKKRKILSKLKGIEPLVAPALGEESKYNIYLSFYSNQKLLGYAAIFCDSTEPRTGYLDILKYFTENINFCLRRDYENRRYGQMMHEAFLVNLMNPAGISQEKVDAQLKNIENLTKKGRFVLGVFEFTGEEKVPIDFVTRILEQNMWDVKAYIYEEQICLLRVLDQDAIATPVIVQYEIENIRRLLANYEFRFGISNVFYDILNLRYAYIQARAAIQYGQRDGKQMARYDEYYYHHMFDCIGEKLPIESLKSEIYLQLQEYDRKNKTQYIKIINTYLENDCNATHAAEKLFVHRNTIRNAVQFVEDRWKIDINDTEEKKRFVISHLIDEYKNVHFAQFEL